jgi:hypothetical protein
VLRDQIPGQSIFRKFGLCLGAVLAFARLGPSEAQTWPPLPERGFTVGHPATEKDVSDGNAIFYLGRADGAVGKPLAITIPQYAYLLDHADSRKKTQVIVVQAEEANALKMFGVRDLTGKEYVVMEIDLQFLGLKP